jgi:hypothetical protein
MNTFDTLIGKTISNIELGEIDEWDQAIIIHTTEKEMYLLQSGSNSSHGMIDLEFINNYPEKWKRDE